MDIVHRNSYHPRTADTTSPWHGISKCKRKATQGEPKETLWQTPRSAGSWDRSSGRTGSNSWRYTAPKPEKPHTSPRRPRQWGDGTRPN
jgi:hypothetical protein